MTKNKKLQKKMNLTHRELMFNPIKKLAIKKQVKYLKEMRPLPLGRKEFEAWSKEILRLAEVPGLTMESGQFALSEMILHVKPTQSFESYGHFVHSLRKGAANQVAHTIFQELKKAQMEKLQSKEIVSESVTTGDEKVLEGPKIQSIKN